MDERSEQLKRVLTLDELVEGWLKLIDMNEETAVSRIVATLKLDSQSKPSEEEVRKFVVEHVLTSLNKDTHGRE